MDRFCHQKVDPPGRQIRLQVAYRIAVGLVAPTGYRLPRGSQPSWPIFDPFCIGIYQYPDAITDHHNLGLFPDKQHTTGADRAHRFDGQSSRAGAASGFTHAGDGLVWLLRIDAMGPCFRGTSKRHLGSTKTLITKSPFSICRFILWRALSQFDPLLFEAFFLQIRIKIR